jgi:hypothetical protein
LILFIAAELLIISKLAPNLHIVLYAVVYIKVFSCSSGTFSGRREKQTQRNNGMGQKFQSTYFRNTQGNIPCGLNM